MPPEFANPTRCRNSGFNRSAAAERSASICRYYGRAAKLWPGVVSGSSPFQGNSTEPVAPPIWQNDSLQACSGSRQGLTSIEVTLPMFGVFAAGKVKPI
jgi:hypothetical protein